MHDSILGRQLFLERRALDSGAETIFPERCARDLPGFEMVFLIFTSRIIKNENASRAGKIV